MPITDCKIHGKSGCPEMCEHLKRDLENGIYSSFYLLPVMTIRMCQGCFVKFNVQRIIDSTNIDSVAMMKKKEKGIYNIAPDYFFERMILNDKNPKIFKEIETIYNQLNKKSGFECLKCIDKIELDYARKNNLELPFEPFENTILHERDEKLNELRSILEEYIKHKGLKLASSTKSYEITRACEIYSGSVKNPVTIKIYGIVAKEEQDELLKIIDSFLKNTSKKQRKIIFFESLNWIIKEGKKDGIIRSRTRDIGKLLSEFVIK